MGFFFHLRFRFLTSKGLMHHVEFRNRLYQSNTSTSNTALLANAVRANEPFGRLYERCVFQKN